MTKDIGFLGNFQPVITSILAPGMTLTFDRWEEVFKDPILTGALVDRVAFQSHVLDMSGDSYRIKKTMSWLSQNEHR